MSLFLFLKWNSEIFFLNASIYIFLTQKVCDFTATGLENDLEIALAQFATFIALKVIINQTHMTEM